MKIDVKSKDKEGTVLFEGSLNKIEVGFLLNFAINNLMAMGCIFDMDKPDNGENRIVMPASPTIQ